MLAEQLVMRPFLEVALRPPALAWSVSRLPPSPAVAAMLGRQLSLRHVIRMGREHPKPKSLGTGPLSALEERHRLRRISLPVIGRRPKIRAECELGPRPCPWISCRYHLYLDVSRRAPRINFPDIEPHQMAQTCALDVAELGGLDLIEVGELVNVTMERARQIEETALLKIKRFADGSPVDVTVAQIRDLIRGQLARG